MFHVKLYNKETKKVEPSDFEKSCTTFPEANNVATTMLRVLGEKGRQTHSILIECHDDYLTNNRSIIPESAMHYFEEPKFPHHTREEQDEYDSLV